MSDENKEVQETKQSTSEASAASENPSSKDAKGAGAKRPKRARRPKRQDRKGPGQVNADLEERVVAVNRCAKVVKGGRRFSFSALIIVGDKNGRVGHGLGKAKEVPEAIRKAKMKAQQKMIQVPLDCGTIPHEAKGEFCSARVMFRPASDGTGVKAAGACRSILELAGITNILTKSVRSNNPHNIVKATFKALKQLRSAEQVAQIRGKDVKGIRIAK